MSAIFCGCSVGLRTVLKSPLLWLLNKRNCWYMKIQYEKMWVVIIGSVNVGYVVLTFLMCLLMMELYVADKIWSIHFVLTFRWINCMKLKNYGVSHEHKQNLKASQEHSGGLSATCWKSLLSGGRFVPINFEWATTNGVA